MGGGRPASQMRPVELVDDDARPDAEGAAGDGGADATAVPGRPGRRVWPWVAGTLAVVLVAAAVANRVTERAAGERADAFGRLPGVVRPLEFVPALRWSAPADGPTPVLAAAGSVVTVSGASGTWFVTAADPLTGAPRWSVPVVEPRGAGFESVAVACTGGTGAVAPVLCTWTEPDVVYGAEAPAVIPPTQVLALDPRSGSRLAQWQLDGTVLDLRRVGDDLVVATALRDRHVLVERRGGLDGTVRWSWTSSGPLVDYGGIRALPALAGDGHVLAVVAVSTTLLDVRTGEVLEDGPPGRQILVASLPDGGYATWESAIGGHLRDADGTPRGDVTALPARLVGDGSIGAVLLDAGNRVVAVDARDAAVLWTLPTSLEPVAAVDGVAVMGGDLSCGAVDARDGRLLWEQELVDEAVADPVTDGLHVLVAEPDRDGGSALVARGLRDGVEAWRVPLPAEVKDVVAVAGRAVVRTATDVHVVG